VSSSCAMHMTNLTPLTTVNPNLYFLSPLSETLSLPFSLELFRSGLRLSLSSITSTTPTEPPLSPFIPKIQNPQIPSSQQYTYQTPTTPRIFTQNQHKSHQIFTQNHHKPQQTPTVEADHKDTTYDLGSGERCETQGYLQSQIKTHA
jgi:hypothetical protein